jgi:hypothetical protein
MDDGRGGCRHAGDEDESHLPLVPIRPAAGIY